MRAFLLGLLMSVAFLNSNTVGHATASPVSATGFVVNATGSNRCAFARIAYNSAAGMSVTAVSYGGVAMTSCGAAAHNATSHAYVEWWVLVDPPTGSNTLAITVAGTVTDIYYNLIAFTGVNPTTPVRPGTYQAVTGSSINPAVTITSNLNDRTVTALNSGGPAITSTNQTSDGIDNTGQFTGASDHATTASTSVTHTWTDASSGNYALAGFSINGDPIVFPPLPVSSGAIDGRPIDALGIDRPYSAVSGITGTVARTLPILTMASAGSVAISGPIVKTLPILTMVSTGTSTIGGALSRTLPILTMASAGSVTITGSVTKTLPILTLAATGTVPIVGTQAPAIPMLRMTASATETITGAISRTLPILTVAMSSAGITGTISKTLPILSITSAGAVADAGVLARTLPILSLVASGTVITPPILGVLSRTLPMLTMEADDHVDVILTATFRVVPVVTGSFAVMPTTTTTLRVVPFLTGAFSIRPQNA